MYLLNPLGLLGLLSLPAIVFLHYFRSQRRQARVGGLHLWEFARRQLPTGRVWRRVFMTLPLLLELLAALVLTLWLAGLSWRADPSRRHAVVVLDDSASMRALDFENREAAQKAAQWILARCDADTRWTLVAAGLEPRVVAGPLADTDQVRAALAEWKPSAPASAVSEAVRFAAKFGEPGQKVILLTDSSAEDEEIADIAERQTFGEPRPNWTLVFADRFRASPTEDRVFALIRRQGGEPGDKTTLSLAASGMDPVKRLVEAGPGQTVRVEFQTPTLERTIELSLPGDPLPLDNKAVLAPTPPRRALAGLALRPALDEYARRAIEALPETYMAPTLDDARLVLTDQIGFQPPPRALVVLRFPPPISPEDFGAATANFFADRASPLLAGLTFEGLIWMFDAKAKPRPGDVVRLRSEGAPLLVEEPRQGRAETFFVNALPEEGNLARSTVWPLLIYNAANIARDRLPGLKRTNFRQGEEVLTGLAEAGEIALAPWVLAGPGGQRRFERAPERLENLPPGLYDLYPDAGGETKSGFRFAVNFFAPEEGDLAALDSKSRADFREATSPGRVREERNPLAYYLPLAILCALLAGLWRLQERGGG